MNTSEIKEIVKKSVFIAVKSCGSQAALAKKAGLTQGAVSKYARGETLPRGETAIALSMAVDGKLKPADFAPHIFTLAEPLSINEIAIERRKVEQRVIDKRRKTERRGIVNP